MAGAPLFAPLPLLPPPSVSSRPSNSLLAVQDKACLDQGNIDRALACLPVFLSGCQILLIIAGPTYCSRLWCVMEIFTFMHMGGSMDRIDIKLISNPDQNQTAARKDLRAQLARFDAAQAQCFKVEDRQRLLAVIEAGFGERESGSNLDCAPPPL